MKHFGTVFHDPGLLKLALTHRSYLSVTGQGPRESNERLEFLGDSVLGLVTSEYLYRRNPDEHEGQLTKTKSLLVSKAILSRRALRMGLGRFVLMSHSEIESGGRQRLSILADAFESVLGAIYLDQGFEASRTFIHTHLLADSDEIAADKRHTNYKSHLQEYVQSTYRTHPVYRIRSEYGPDHSKHFMVEVMVGRRTLGEGRGHNKKEAEQAAARSALENVKRMRGDVTEASPADDAPLRTDEREGSGEGRGRRRRRGGRGRPGPSDAGTGEPQRAAGGTPPDEGVVEEYEAEEDAVADEQEFDVEVLDAGNAPATHVHDDEADEDEDDDEEDDDLADDGEEEDEDDDDLADDEVDESEVVDDLDETADDEIDDEADDDAGTERTGREPNPVHEELHVDPFGAGEDEPEAAVDPAQAERERLEAAKRVADMERAMDSFGQRRPEAYGRRGRPARRGR
jgi:ribonuclease-3